MTAIRMLFIVMSILIFVGIWLSGYNTVHWILYLPAVFLAFAGITGICPGYIIFKKLGLKDTGVL
jgi:ABC-type polysaccharide/polyol phosphate export permease